MDAILRDGSLRVMTLESSCDVIISCQGHKLKAHKIMLSIASPLLQELLLAEKADTSVIIIPDISPVIMTYILDYIYTGSVLLQPSSLAEFLSCANLLRLRVDPNFLEPKAQEKPYTETYPRFKSNDPYTEFDPYKVCSECGPECYSYSRPCYPESPKFKFPEGKLKFTPIVLQDERHREVENVQINGSVDNAQVINYSVKEFNEMPVGVKKKTLRKVPNLMPISRGNLSAFKAKKGLYNRVFPSPWIPKVVPFNGDPKSRFKHVLGNMMPPKGPDLRAQNVQMPKMLSPEENDKNNNLQKMQARVDTTAVPVYVPQESQPLDLNTHIHLYRVQPKTHHTQEQSRQPDHEAESSNNKKQELFTDYSSAESNSNSNDATLNRMVIEKSDEDIKEEDSNGKNKPYKCEDCGKQFSQLRNYKYHRSVHEGTKEFAARCPECGKTFNDKGYLSSHLKIHRDRKEYGCPHCPKRFNQRVAYNMHLRIHTGVKPHVCSTCGKSFSRKMLLKQHQRVHTGERPYQCPECGKTFADRSNMSLHARLHTGVKPYSCSLCPKSFTKKHHLKTHMNYHTGLKPYECQKCGLTFSQSSNMRTHYKKCIQKTNTNEPTTNNPS